MRVLQALAPVWFVAFFIGGAIALPRIYAAETLKRRVLVLPLENVLRNKNYAWMSDSIAENLKSNLLRSGRFEVLDVALLRKIDSSIQFAGLDATNASALARRLNCEVAIVGHYKARRQGRHDIVMFQVDAVDALEKKSVVVKNEEAAVNAEIFDAVKNLAQTISDELSQSLEPLDSEAYHRDDRVEKLIRRIENPPKGFLDTFTLGASPGSPPVKSEPAFDIDTFEYDIYVDYDQAEGVSAYLLDYQYWGRRRTPTIRATGGSCERARCVFTSRDPVVTLADVVGKQKITYTFKIHLPHPKGPLVSRWWVTAGYPATKSFALLGQSNPETLAKDGGIPFDAMRGFGHFEAGLGSGRLQFSDTIKWALVTQAFFAQGDVSQFVADSGYDARLSLLSVGGGLRLDRSFLMSGERSRTGRYGFAPFVGLYVHYQQFFRELAGAALTTAAFVPEIGINQYFRFGYKLRWRWVLTLAAGSFIYSDQNLSYARASVGVEYAFR